jgi:signal transduction histidine kinase/ActR/RegA family two-component response regulator
VRQSLKRKYIFTLCSGLYVLGLIVFFYNFRSHQENLVLEFTDKALKSAALTIPHLLPEDFQDRAKSKDSISFSEEMEIRRKLGSFTARINLPFVYTVVEKNGEFFFSASNVSKKEAQRRKRWYFYPYRTIPDEFVASYRMQKPVFATYIDQFGIFRSCAIPMVSPGGRVYLACADSDNATIQTRLAQARNHAFYITLFFALLGLPFLFVGFLYLVRLDQWNEDLIRYKENLEISVANRTLELEKARDDLIQSREQLLMALQTGKIAVFKWNLGAELIDFTQTMSSELEKFESPRMSSREFKSKIYNADRKLVFSKLASYVSGHLDELNISFRFKFSEENYRWLHLIGRIVERSSTGIGQVVVGIVEDITELKNRETAMQQSQKLEAVGQLAGGIAHDFNNMLQAIIGYAEMVKMSLKDDDDNKDCIDSLIEAANKSQTLVSQLLTFSRMSREIKETLDVNLMLEDYITMLERLLGEQIDIVTEFGSGLPYVVADSGQLEQVIINLCVNARDAMNGKGRIKIKTEKVKINQRFCSENPWAKPGHFVKISVKDNGPGIPPKELKKIFEPFYTTKEVGKGTGLGLAIVYGVIQKHNGLLNLKSELGKGAEFEIYLPASDVLREIKSRTSVEVDESLEGEETILLAEDSELVRNFAGRMLRKAGYKVLFAVNGKEAVEQFKRHKNDVDILVFDIIMPEMTGRSAYEKIKELGGDLPVVFCSGYHEEILDSAFYADFNGRFLPKPYKTADLLRNIRKLLEEQKLRPH